MSPYRTPATREPDAEDRELAFAVRLAAAVRFLMRLCEAVAACQAAGITVVKQGESK